MANEEHLAILRQGVKVWNQWRKEQPDIEPDLQQTNFSKADLRGANLYETNLYETNLYRTILSEANLMRAVLEEADLREANLTRANISEANLYGTTLEATILKGATLERANLTRANFTRAILNATNLMHAHVGSTIFGDLDLRQIYGLDTIQHSYPSHISIDTLYRSQGQIPEAFLRGCGVPDSMIGYARSLVTAERPIDYYSMFISYSSTDQALAERLYADLQSKGVRCWFAPHDLEIGTEIVRGIDEAIRIYDKLLIILSEASVKSHWVAFEVSQALHREVEQGHTMLFPIRLDDTVLHTSSGWAAQLRSRHIGDFRGWKDHDRYQAAFSRLLQALKAKE